MVNVLSWLQTFDFCSQYIYILGDRFIDVDPQAIFRVDQRAHPVSRFNKLPGDVDSIQHGHKRGRSRPPTEFHRQAHRKSMESGKVRW